MSARIIQVRTCQNCPFAQCAGTDRYCAIDPGLHTVTDWHTRGKMPNFCPLLHSDFTLRADVTFSRPGA